MAVRKYYRWKCVNERAIQSFEQIETRPICVHRFILSFLGGFVRAEPINWWFVKTRSWELHHDHGTSTSSKNHQPNLPIFVYIYIYMFEIYIVISHSNTCCVAGVYVCLSDLMFFGLICFQQHMRTQHKYQQQTNMKNTKTKI